MSLSFSTYLSESISDRNSIWIEAGCAKAQSQNLAHSKHQIRRHMLRSYQEPQTLNLLFLYKFNPKRLRSYQSLLPPLWIFLLSIFFDFFLYFCFCFCFVFFLWFSWLRICKKASTVNLSAVVNGWETMKRCEINVQKDTWYFWTGRLSFHSDEFWLFLVSPTIFLTSQTPPSPKFSVFLVARWWFYLL